MPRSRDAPEEDFEGLLAWLHPDGEKAAVTYEAIRGDLIRIFRWRGCSDPEGMADETIRRVTRKVRQIAATYTGSPALYFYGVAKNLLHEYERGREISLSTQHEPSAPPEQLDEGDDAAERRHDCFERCLKKLDARERRVIVRYYTGEGHAKIVTRQRLAETLGIDLNALRVRTRRTRAKLRECIEKCLDEKPAAT